MTTRQETGVSGLMALADLLVLNALFVGVWALFKAWPEFYIHEELSFRALAVAWNAASILALVVFRPARSTHRGLRTDQIAGAAFVSACVVILFFCACVAAGKFAMPGRRRIGTLLLLAPVFLFFSHLIFAKLVKSFVRHGRMNRRILFVGDSPALNALARTMTEEGWKDFADITHVATAEAAFARLKESSVAELYCSLAKEMLPSAQRLFNHCENNLIRFYGVPEIHEYFDRNLLATSIDDIPVLTPRDEPLRRLANRALKRALDIVLSLGFLTTIFAPIAIFAAFKIKRESPGPVFFRQRRHGLDGREFLCWKFRSMHVNDRSDIAQTAVDDPRKFPFGDFMRRTNIDELPQFINVLVGDMSVVGPRPHPVKMTDDYGEIVNRYRVRLYAKPGVTGWAQVNGARGATLKVDDMIKRVRLDIWYLEHWTFWLDLMIIVRTFLQTVSGKNKNAF